VGVWGGWGGGRRDTHTPRSTYLYYDWSMDAAGNNIMCKYVLSVCFEAVKFHSGVF
jgi:hypothetical protein